MAKNGSILLAIDTGELELPKPAEENIAPAIPNPESIGDVGHRS